MRADILPRITPPAVAILGLLLLILWCLHQPTPPGMKARVPGMDLVGVERAAAQTVDLAGTFARGTGQPANLPGAWPRFRGVKLDNISTETVPLARQWSSQGPPVLWETELGEGYAGAAVLNGRVYVLDYDQQQEADSLRCLSLADGAEIWRHSYQLKVKRNHGMSRTVPTVTDKYVVTFGPKCHVLCLDAVSGKFLWGLDLVKQFHAKVPAWYAGQCPLIDNDLAILAPGGDALMIAVECATGKIRWQTPNPNGWDQTHSTILPMTFRGRKMYVYCAGGGVVGVSATDGKVLWQTPEWKISIANIPTPLDVGDGRIFLCGGYNAGAMMLKLTEENGRLVPKILYRLKSTVFGSDQQSPILYNGYIYGVIPGGQLVCLSLEGKQVWASGPKHRFGLGPYMIANGLIYVMDDNGLLTLAEATPDGYRQLTQAQILDGIESWGPFALAGGRLLARDLTKMVCLDVAKH